MATYLYATDFHNGRIDVFDNTFASQTWSGAFIDPRLPKGYAPFGIQNLKGLLFVTYAKTQPGSDDELAGQGRGVVDVFLTDGTFFGRVARGGGLNAPWGLAWAPDDFGRFSGDLIVGNFGDGKLHAYARHGNGWHADGALQGHRPSGDQGRRPVGDRVRRGNRQQRPDEHALLRRRSQRRGGWCLRHDRRGPLTRITREDEAGRCRPRPRRVPTTA